MKQFVAAAAVLLLGVSAAPLAQAQSGTAHAIQADANPQSAATADLDGDGDLDAITALNDSKEVVWYANDGDGNFGSAQTIADVSYINSTKAVWAADLDGDGDQDVLVGGQGPASGNGRRSLSYVENTGGGNFGSAVEIDATVTYSIRTADYDHDGDVDVIKTSGYGGGTQVFPNTGSGINFGAPINLNASGRTVALADLNDDGFVDVITNEDRGASTYVFANDGSGGFESRVTVSTGNDQLWGVAAGDLDGDGDPDLVEVDRSTPQMSWYENTTSSSGDTPSFGAENVIAGSGSFGQPRNVVISDRELDGDNDIYVTDVGDDEISLFRNDGSGSFSAEEQIVSVDGPNRLRAVDLDDDADEDILSTNIESETLDFAWFENDEATANTAPTAQDDNATTDEGQAVTVNVLDNDSDADGDALTVESVSDPANGTAAIASSEEAVEYTPDGSFTGDDTFTYTVNDGQGETAQATVTVTVEAARPMAHVIDPDFDAQNTAAADLDGDGDQDVLEVSDGGSNPTQVRWFANDGNGSFGSGTALTTSATEDDINYLGVNTADLDGDGDQDVLAGGFGPPQGSSNGPPYRGFIYIENTGSGSFNDPVLIASEVVYSIEAGDFDGDGDLDLATNGTYGAGAATWENTSDGSGISFGPANSLGVSGRTVEVEDLNGDGSPDVIATGSNSDPTTAYESNGDGTFGSGIAISANESGSRSWAVEAGDLDGDGDADVIHTDRDNNEVEWYENTTQSDGDTPSFSSANLIDDTDLDQPRGVELTDWEADGDLDALVSVTDNDKLVLYRNDGSGSFGSEEVIAEPNGSVRVRAADLNGDNAPDALSANQVGDELAWYENTSDVGPQVTTIAEARAENDGDDVVVEGVVTRAMGRIFRIQDPTAGIAVFGGANSYVADEGIEVGDSLRVTGSRSDFNGLQQISPDMITTLQEDVAVPAAQDVTLSELSNNGESFESELVQLEGLQVVNSDDDNFQASTSYTVENDAGEQFTLRVQQESDSELAGTPIYDTFDFTGVVGEFNGTYQLIPVAETDITEVTTQPPPQPMAHVIASDVVAWDAKPADLNDDGDQDVLVASDGPEAVIRYENQGDGTFADGDSLSTLTAQYIGVNYADLDGDGDLDVIAGSFGRPESKPAGPYRRVLYIENQGDGTYAAPVDIARIVAYSVDTGDFDGDGDLDLATIGGYGDGATVFENTTDGSGISFGSGTPLGGGVNGRTLKVDDINDDGLADVLAAVEGSATTLFVSNGDGTFGAGQAISTDNETLNSVTTGDIDGDGDLDVISVDRDAPKIEWYPNTTAASGDSPSFGEATLIDSTDIGAPRDAAVVDWDLDGDQDVLAAIEGNDAVLLYRNDGSGTFAEEEVIGEITTPLRVSSADLDGDGDADALASSREGETVKWFENTENPIQKPVAQNDEVRTGTNTTITIDVLANDSDPAGGDLTLESVSDPDNGDAQAVFDDGKRVRYEPDDDFMGTDTFTYTVSNEAGGTDQATVTVEVGGQTARTNLARVKAAAREKIPDAQLIAATSASISEEDGTTSESWSYVFVSPDLEETVTVVKSADGQVVTIRNDFSNTIASTFLDSSFSPQPLPDDFIDSDEAVQRAEDVGGGDFRSDRDNTVISALLVSLPGNVSVGTDSEDESGAVWLFTYADPDTGESTVFAVDAQTGNARKLERALAQDNLDAANTAAGDFASDAELVSISTVLPDLDREGASFLWRFTYASESEGAARAFLATSGTVVASQELVLPAPSGNELPDEYLGADEALAKADSSLEAELGEDSLSVFVQAQLSEGLLPTEPSRLVWQFIYVPTTIVGAPRVVYVDALTGDVIMGEGTNVITIAAARKMAEDEEVAIEGVVTRAKGNIFRIQDPTAGIAVFGGTDTYAADNDVEKGDSLRVVGTRSNFNGLQEINPDTLITLKEDAVVPAPKAVTLSELSEHGERYESELVKLEGLTVTDPEGAEVFEASMNYTVVNNDGEEFTLRVQSEADSETPGTTVYDAFNYTGVVGEFSGEYQLIPVYESDIRDITATDPSSSLPTEFALQGNYPNPVQSATTISMDLPKPATVRVEVINTLGRRVRSLAAKEMGSGSDQTLQLEARGLPAGMYIYRVVAEAGDTTWKRSGKMMVVR